MSRNIDFPFTWRVETPGRFARTPWKSELVYDTIIVFVGTSSSYKTHIHYNVFWYPFYALLSTWLAVVFPVDTKSGPTALSDLHVQDNGWVSLVGGISQCVKEVYFRCSVPQSV